MLETLGNALNESFIEIVGRFVDTAPKVVLAILLLVVGWFLASWVAQGVAALINGLKLDNALGQTGLRELSEKAHFNLSVGNFFGFIIKWGLILVVVQVAFGTLGFTQLNNAIDVFLAYVPQIVVAGAILIATALFAQFLDRVVVTSAKAADVKQARTLGFATRIFVWIVGITTALSQLQVAVVLVMLFQTLMTGFIAAFAIALGIAFGLGGKDAAARVVHKIEEEMK